MVEIWKKRWKNSEVRNVSPINNPELKVPGFDLPRALWTTLNRASTEQGKCNYLMHKWGKVESPLCACGMYQTIRHIVDNYRPQTYFEGGLEKLHKAEEDTVKWMENLKLRL
ncbi:Hypothetical protein CINCED_3A005334 [Cinara cedri]|uniref:Uncharacterized protein n=1 Tax=Cinara cedri TaxID=506608 RepID=A0A5E4NIJ0_9HEMI|nr:Hypothetical protein CINCED_3A005334 [Cinara cedri]